MESGVNGKPAGWRAAVSVRVARKRGWMGRGLRIGQAVRLAMIAGVLAAGCSAAGTSVAAARSVAAGPAAAAPFVYVADKGRNEVSQFGVLSSGTLRALTPQTVASGPFPTSAAVTPQGNSLYVVDVGSDSAPVNEVSQYTISPATGKLTPKSPATVQTGGAPTWIAVAPGGKSAYVADFGADAISQYSISPATGKLAPQSPATVQTPGSPGAIAIAPDGKNAYEINVSKNSVSQYRISPATGALSARPVATVAAGRGLESVTIAPDGRSAYVTDAMDDTISQYRINPATGKLTPGSPATVTTTGGPHDLAITPDGKNAYVLTALNNTISQYSISPATGTLSSTPVSTATTVLHPEVIALTPDGKNAYVTSENDGALSQFAISPVTGKMTPLAPATVTTPPSGSLGLAVTPAADMSAKASAPATAQSGSALTYTIKITDTGPSQAWQAALTDHLPAGTAFRSATATSGTSSHPSVGTRGATVKCHLGTLQAGAAWRIQIKVTVTASRAIIRGEADVTSVTPDPRTSNNIASALTKITK
jgi:6-phosphogluconolactonase